MEDDPDGARRVTHQQIWRASRARMAVECPNRKLSKRDVVFALYSP
jgi:hypothetical protein